MRILARKRKEWGSNEKPFCIILQISSQSPSITICECCCVLLAKCIESRIVFALSCDVCLFIKKSNAASLNFPLNILVNPN